MNLSKKGFTLIELLAVIVIIAIIALIGIPSVTRIIDNSRKDAIKSTALAMANAARNVLASDNLTVPVGVSGCSINWVDLNMESNQLPAGGAVAPTVTHVKLTQATENDPIVYTIYLYNAATDASTYIDGQTTTVLNATGGRDLVKINSETKVAAPAVTPTSCL